MQEKLRFSNDIFAIVTRYSPRDGGKCGGALMETSCSCSLKSDILLAQKEEKR